MVDKYAENIMLYAVLANIRILAEKSLKGNKVYQITVGRKSEGDGIYIQSKNNEVTVKQGIYEGKPDCRLHFITA